ncbi:MAG: YdcF family protein, partial [Turicibacter sp.]
LVANGVDDSKIILEDQSKNTFENFKFSKQKIEEHSEKKIEDLKIKVVTSDFHSFRSSILAKRNGYQHVTFYSSPSRIQFAPTYYAREFFALLKALVLYK